MPRIDHRSSRPFWVHSDPTAPPEPEQAPSLGPCPHRCNGRWRRAVEDHERTLNAWIAAGCHGPEPDPVDLEPWPGAPVLCRRCTAIVRSALRELPLAYDALDSVKFLTRTASADEERRGRSDVPPSPSPGADHQDEILRTVAAWEDDLRKHLGHQAAPYPEGALTASVEYLNTNWAAMLERPEAAPDFTDEIWHLHRVALAMVKNKPVRRYLPVPCPSCDTKALVQEEGIARRPWYVECAERLGGCSRLFSESEYDWLRSLITSGHVPGSVAV